MARVRESVEAKLAALNNLQAESGREKVHEQIKAAVANRHCRVAAKAAALCAEQLLYDLQTDLLAAYDYFVKEPLKRDPNCIAKRAIARALVDLDCHDVSFYLRGLHYYQKEPVWGGSVDTAIDVRCSCAMGLVATGHPRALPELTLLLNDSEARVRLGVVRAIAYANPREAEVLLRLKVLIGDPEPEVTGECFAGLLSVEPDESLPFIEPYLYAADEAIRGLAALALGESRFDAALELLKKAWAMPGAAAEFRRVLMRAVALHRSDAALDWLISIIEEAEPYVAEDALEVLAIYKHNERLTRRLRTALNARNNPLLSHRFVHLWDEI